jgi:GTP-dependent phosphoenolpyruvate carboxykinase
VAAASQMYDEGQEAPDFLGEAMEYVYDESDPIDRKIIEFTTGYGGSPMLSKKEIADRLGISPSQVTRRADRIGMKIQDMDYEIEKTYT